MSLAMVAATPRITADLLDHEEYNDAPVAFVGLDAIMLVRVDASVRDTAQPTFAIVP